jgi:hypothetical protein
MNFHSDTMNRNKLKERTITWTYIGDEKETWSNQSRLDKHMIIKSKFKGRRKK